MEHHSSASTVDGGKRFTKQAVIMSADPTLRASDSDRERVAAELGEHHGAGRLDTAEFEERLSSAYAARTMGELDTLLTDLPARRKESVDAPSAELAEPERAESPATRGPGRFPIRYGSWLAVSVTVLAVWAFSYVATGDTNGFWPVWVIGPWGLAVLFGHSRGR